MATFPCIAVTGPRQSGKSTLLIHTLKGYKYVTLDDPITREQAISDPQLLLDTLGTKVIIDEIQLAPRILSYIKIRIDSARSVKGQFVFTGSQQFSLIKNLGDSLAGRIGLFDLLPFSLDEMLKAASHKTVTESFVHAALRGLYPEPVTDMTIKPERWFGSYVQTYLERDVRSIYNIGNLRDFQRFMQLLAGRVGQLLNLSSFASDLGVSVSTIKSWLSILEAGRIIYLLPPYYNNLGKRVTKAPKAYFLDIGLVCYLTGIRDKTHLLQGPLAGPLFENFCVQETVKHFLNAGQRPPLYYLRTSNNLEVDLLIEKSYQELIPVEIKLSKTPTPVMAKPVVRIKETFDKLPLRDGFLVSLSEKSIQLTADVKALPLDGFLKKL
ncbi:MAG: ATP-binding protein [Thermodesulfovibrionales bacterium]|nr:ATP-binding protein [Thermodesulfovibrionales bacterium]